MEKAIIEGARTVLTEWKPIVISGSADISNGDGGSAI